MYIYIYAVLYSTTITKDMIVHVYMIYDIYAYLCKQLWLWISLSCLFRMCGPLGVFTH